MACTPLEVHRYFGLTYCLRLQNRVLGKQEFSIFLRNVRELLSDYIVTSHHRKYPPDSLLWEPHFQQKYTVIVKNIVTSRGLCVTYKTGYGLDAWTYWHLIHTQLGTTGYYSAITDLRTLQFTITHALGFSVFASRILAMALWRSHCHFRSHKKSSFHSLTPCLQLPIPKTRLDSIPLLPSSYPGRLAPRNSTLFFSNEPFFITTLHWRRRKHSLSIVWKTCSQRRCIATEVTQLLLAYSLPRECVYRVVVYQWPSILTSLFRLSGVMSQYF
jgi:hypothetical protein